MFAHIVGHFVVTGVIAMMSSMREMLVLNCFDIDGHAAVRREGEKDTTSNRVSLNQIGRYDEEFDDRRREREKGDFLTAARSESNASSFSQRR